MAKTIKEYLPSEITFINTCNAIYDETMLIKGLEFLCLKFPKKNVKVVLSTTGYPEIWINGHLKRIHRVIGQYVNNDKDGKFVYHHKDENKLNASIENITPMTRAEHRRFHGHNFHPSDEHKKSVSNAQKGNHNKSKPVVMIDINGDVIKEFPSVRHAIYAIGSYTNEMYRHLRGETEFCKGYKFKYIQI